MMRLGPDTVARDFGNRCAHVNRPREVRQLGPEESARSARTEWIRRSTPALRIVSDEQWHAAHSRLTGIRERLIQATGGPLGNRRPRDIESKYLLAGFARCAVCGGGLGVTSGSHSSARGHVYGCLAYHKRGTSICGNGLRVPIDRVDHAVLKTLAGDVLRPAIAEAVIDGVLAALNPRALELDVEGLRAELERVDAEIANVTEAIAVGGELAPLLQKLKARQVRRDALECTIAARSSVDVRRFDRTVIESKAREHLNAWHGLLTKHVEDGRQLLREVLAGPLRFTLWAEPIASRVRPRLGDCSQGRPGLQRVW